jgi:FtsZ-interacting cell division protein ZipA
MNIIMFIVGAVIFVIFIVGVVWEAKTEQKATSEDYEHYGGEGCNQPEPTDDELK